MLSRLRGIYSCLLFLWQHRLFGVEAGTPKKGLFDIFWRLSCRVSDQLSAAMYNQTLPHRDKAMQKPGNTTEM